MDYQAIGRLTATGKKEAIHSLHFNVFQRRGIHENSRSIISRIFNAFKKLSIFIHRFSDITLIMLSIFFSVITRCADSLSSNNFLPSVPRSLTNLLPLWPLSQSVYFTGADLSRSGQTSPVRPHSSLALYVHLVRLCKL